MAKKLEFWGILCTVVYLLVIATTVAFKFDSFVKLELNALGDFLAGAFGPIAFLWLVLGFLQQGRELKLSTDALQLQAQELKNSVEQQSIMASAAIKQIEAAQRAFTIQQAEAERAISADFGATIGYKTGGRRPNTAINKFYLENSGNSADQVIVTFDPPFDQLSKVEIGMIKSGGKWESELIFDTSRAGSIGELLIEYEGVDGKSRCEYFTYLISEEHWVIFKKRRAA